MHDFLVSIMPVALWVFMAFHLVMFVVLTKRFAVTKNGLFGLAAAVTFGLWYDALILSLGTVLKAGALLGLSQFRFISHGGLIPLIFPICALALNARPGIRKAVYVLTAIIVVLGIAEGICTVLEERTVAGVVRFASADSTPGWANTVSMILSYGTVVPLIIVGIVAWAKQHTPTLFLSGFLMFTFSALGPASGNFDLIFFISMAGEVFMVLFFWLYGENRVKAAK